MYRATAIEFPFNFLISTKISAEKNRAKENQQKKLITFNANNLQITKQFLHLN